MFGRKQKSSAAEPEVPTLQYVVPNGQDPAVVLNALDHEGYTVVPQQREGEPVLVVYCPAGVDRERAHVRSVIAATDETSMFDPAPGDQTEQSQRTVRFADE
jgi:hypothetical protein